MLKKHFKPYTELIKKAISASTTPEHLHCCFDMIFRMNEHFKLVVPFTELQPVKEELEALYNQQYHCVENGVSHN